MFVIVSPIAIGVSVGLLRDEDRPELEHGHHVGYRLGVGGQLVVRLREVFHEAVVLLHRLELDRPEARHA